MLLFMKTVFGIVSCWLFFCYFYFCLVSPCDSRRLCLNAESKQLAMWGAAAKTLDCYAFRACDDLFKKPFMRCSDAPHMKGKAPALPSLPDGVVLPTNALEIKTAGLNLPSADTTIDCSPKILLMNWYQFYWRRIDEPSFRLSHPSVQIRTPHKDSYTTWSVKSPKLFTSVFVCPWTGERFLSGKLVDKKMEYFEQNFILGDQGSKKGGEIRSLVWYRKLL